MSEPAPIVEMRRISVAFPGVRALDQVDFRLLPGEVHALMGENGAGKSTLIKALTGVQAVDDGEILIDGRTRRLSGAADARAAGISAVFQEVNLCPNLSIGENVLLGHEVRGRFGIDWAATHRAVDPGPVDGPDPVRAGVRVGEPVGWPSSRLGGARHPGSAGGERRP